MKCDDNLYMYLSPYIYIYIIHIDHWFILFLQTYDESLLVWIHINVPQMDLLHPLVVSNPIRTPTVLGCVSHLLSGN